MDKLSVYKIDSHGDSAADVVDADARDRKSGNPWIVTATIITDV